MILQRIFKSAVQTRCIASLQYILILVFFLVSCDCDTCTTDLSPLESRIQTLETCLDSLILNQDPCDTIYIDSGTIDSIWIWNTDSITILNYTHDTTWIYQTDTNYIYTIDSVWIMYPDIPDSAIILDSIAEELRLKLYVNDTQFIWRQLLNVPVDEFYTDTIYQIDTGTRPMKYYHFHDNLIVCDGDTLDPYLLWQEMLNQAGIVIE